MAGDAGLRIAGEIGFTYWLNQASGVRLAGTVAQHDDRRAADG